MKPHLQRGKALLIPLSLLLFGCAARQEASRTNTPDIELRAALLDSYDHADVVAHIKINITENMDTLFADDGTPGYFLNAVNAKILLSYKGPFGIGTEIAYAFQSDFDAALDPKWAAGTEWIVFLNHERELGHGLRCEEMPCQVQATADVMQLMTEFRGSSP